MDFRYLREPLDMERVEGAHQNRLREDENTLLACCCALQRLDPSDPQVPHYALHLASHLTRRYTCIDEADDLEQALNVCQWALQHPDLPAALRAALLDQLGRVVGLLWRRDHRLPLEEALSAHLESSACRKAHGLDESDNIFCVAMATFYLALSDPEPSAALYDSLALMKTAARTAKCDEFRAEYLTVACNIHIIIYENVGENLLDDALAMLKEAVGLTGQDSPHYGLVFMLLGGVLWKKFQSRTVDGTSEDLEAALLALKRARRITATTSPALHRRIMHNLGWALLTSFEHTGNMDDLDEAMEIARENVATWGDAMSRTVATRKLQLCLRRRYERLGIPEDLDESIQIGRMALEATPSGDSERSYNLCLLASSLLQRYTRSHALADLEEANNLSKESIMGPKDVRFGVYLRTLGEARFHRALDITQNLDELREAVQALRESLDLIQAEDKIGRIEVIDSLASALRAQSQMTNCVDYLEEAVAFRQSCLSDIPNVRPDYPHIQALLADDLSALHRLVNRPNDFLQSMRFFRDSVKNPYGNPRDSLQSGKRWIQAARSSGCSNLVFEAYHHTVGLLPRLAYTGYHPETRLQFLRDTPGLAIEAANHALLHSRTAEAVEILEQGRSVLWNRALQHRYRFDDLPPHFAERLNALTAGFARPIGRELAGGNISDSAMSQRRHLIDKFELVLREVRQTPGFESYFLPKKCYALQAAAAMGPVVLLLAGETQSHAIIVRSSGKPQQLPLSVTSARLAEFASMLSAENTTARRRDTSYPYAPDAHRLHVQKQKWNSENSYTGILAELWHQVVHPVIATLNLQGCTLDQRPRLWWCPTGPFTFLPVHAAGIYYGRNTDVCTSDCVISSYCPSLQSLIKARQDYDQSSDIAIFRVLLVGQPEAPRCT
ncbi:hypothetical protein PUNSTDRAFT_126120, partial [Punctularia strigosozonata HHB-11173 SS5]|uniref:uncharacterized protein n=1 Tax=Punctularia strigosozonata (strain HHB-11173) TaxID=741275 RepID=UPI0004417385